ncbi:hypothetical protein NK8_65330 (plasmid) [Caballeronia sp. NK8]|nr:hypothetical protein NK8_65330 [Caballeronia sp. NK8]
MPSLWVVAVADALSETVPSAAISCAATDAFATGPIYTPPDVDADDPPHAERNRENAALAAAVRKIGFTMTLLKRSGTPRFSGAMTDRMRLR